MQYNFILLRTDKGRKYANKILSSIKWINEHKYPQHRFDCYEFTISEFLTDDGRIESRLNPANTIIHARCANPRTEWTIKLRELENAGYKVVNSVDCIELTSNKLACSLHLQGKVNHPKSWEYRKNFTNSQLDNLISEINLSLNPWKIIAKPLTSLEQGKNVRLLSMDNVTNDQLRREFDSVPGNKIVIQEYIPYTALHRVIVINNKALPYTFIDKPEWHPTDWKVSCCLNRTTMKLNERIPDGLLSLAEETQKEVGGIINFIDIFEYKVDIGGGAIPVSKFTNAEINTACSLNIHEKLAKNAGRSDWNIHYRIGKCLVEKLLNS
jgi:glutathione synthase/RimK-type ligase-like ATP-grasp enzyme